VSAAPDPERDPGRRHKITISVTRADEDLLEALSAALKCDRGRAISHLLDVHAGREVERAREAERPFPVVRWAKPKLGLDLIGYIAGLVRAGNLVEVAASMAGVSPKQLADWRRRGRSDLRNGVESVYADFVANLDAAQAEVEAEGIQELRRAGARDWRATAWYLARLYPERYGERKRVDRTSQVNLIPVIDWERLTIPQTRQLVELLRIASPEVDDPRINKTNRPALELLPPDVVESAEAPPIGETIDGEATEAPPLEDESPDAREAPALGGEPGAADPALANARSENTRSGEPVFGEQPFAGTPVRTAADDPSADDPSDARAEQHLERDPPTRDPSDDPSDDDDDPSENGSDDVAGG
jgi:hypothetical protein